MWFNSLKRYSWAVPLYHEANDMLHMISDRCAARDSQTIAMSECVVDSSRRNEEIIQISNCAFQCDHYHFYYHLQAHTPAYSHLILAGLLPPLPLHWDDGGPTDVKDNQNDHPMIICGHSVDHQQDADHIRCCPLNTGLTIIQPT